MMFTYSDAIGNIYYFCQGSCGSTLFFDFQLSGVLLREQPKTHASDALVTLIRGITYSVRDYFFYFFVLLAALEEKV